MFRAKLILALADGWTWARIAATLRTSRKTIAVWRARFEEGGIDGLEPRHKGSQPRAATAAVQARVARRVQQKPPDGSTHWSCRKLAADLGMSHATVQRILAQAKLQPHRLDRYMASNDPDFEEKAADIIGLYMVQIRLSMQLYFVSTRKRPFRRWTDWFRCCPFSPEDAPNGMVSGKYYRHGTLSLYAALDVKTGKVERGKTTRRHTSADFIGIPDGHRRQNALGQRDSYRAR